MQRKPGGYRQPTQEQRALSRIPKDQFRAWFQQTWKIPGARTREHPAPYPVELASRLVRMFSFVGDTVLDPFAGLGTTLLAAARAMRNSIGGEIEPAYCRLARTRFDLELTGKLSGTTPLRELAGTPDRHPIDSTDCQGPR